MPSWPHRPSSWPAAAIRPPAALRIGRSTRRRQGAVLATKRAPNVQYLPIDQLVPAEDNFRGPVGDVVELAESIRAVGILQHLVVTPKADGGYRLVFGHRRLEAARQAGLTEVPAEIRDYSDAERFTAMFAENYGRKDLSPLQEARAYQAMLELTDGKGRKVFTQRSLAKRLGVGLRSPIPASSSCPSAATMLEQGELTVTEAVLLVRLAKYPDRVEAALADYGRHTHKDMDLAVRSQQADLEREERVEQVRHDLKAAGVRLAPDDWRARWQAARRRLLRAAHDGRGPRRRAVPRRHGHPPRRRRLRLHRARPAPAGREPTADCHPRRRRRRRPPTPAVPEPTPMTRTTADAAGRPGRAGAGRGAAAARADRGGAGGQAAHGGGQAGRRAGAPERERLARERAEQLEAAYQARTSALQALLGGRLSRPEAPGCWPGSWCAWRSRTTSTTTASSGRPAPGRDHRRRRRGRVAGAGPGRQERRRPAPGGRGDRRRARRGVAGVPTSPTSPARRALYYDFLTKAAAYKPSEFELAELGASERARTPGPRRRRRLLAWPSCPSLVAGRPASVGRPPFAVPWR